VTRPKVDSRICVVVPTVRRNRNGFQYLNETLDRHRKVLASSLFLDRFLYLSESDIGELDPLLKRAQLTPIYRKRHPEVLGLEEGGYAWWRSSLCLDFVHSMSRALELSGATYFRWLEDDTYLARRFPAAWNEFRSKHPNFHAVSAFHEGRYGGGGTCCMIFEREALREFAIRVREQCLEDLPLDWMVGACPWDVHGFRVKSAFHIGTFSSRRDHVTRLVDPKRWIPRSVRRVLRRIRLALFSG
jgi:hypothetical protein